MRRLSDRGARGARVALLSLCAVLTVASCTESSGGDEGPSSDDASATDALADGTGDDGGSPDADAADTTLDAAGDGDASQDVSQDDVEPGDLGPQDTAGDATSDIQADVENDGAENDALDITEDAAPDGAENDALDGGDGATEVDSAPSACTSDQDCNPENTCMLGTCDADTGECVETPLPEGSDCEDGNACSTGDTCTAQGWCMGLQAINCDDSNPCTDDVCDPAVGCVLKNNFAPCDDDDPCTTGEKCSGGACAGAVPLCEDNNPCTVDSCDPDSGTCENTADDTLPCDDDSACTLGDACVSGACVPGAADGCDDDNQCTADICDAGVCLHAATDGADCDDGDACTEGDSCAADACAPGEAVDCDDQNPCTTTSCESASGCATVVLEGQDCDDEDACSPTSACDGLGACVGTSVQECDDENPCTVNDCDVDTGCTTNATDDACDDEDACTVDDQCQPDGSCSGAVDDCDDENACTEDSCAWDVGCEHVDQSASCESDDPCMDASCDPGQGCVTIPNTLPCNDLDACTEGDVCAEGVCAGETVVCDDEDVCTSDSCDVTDGCQNVAVDKPCDDGDACTVDEACEALDPVCNGGSAVNIDDGVSCTLDSCDSIEGPEHTPDPTLCDVGEACDPIAGCQPGDMNLVVSKFSIYPTEPMVDGQGQWFAVTNVGETVVDITAVFVFNDQGQGASVKATTGDASDSVLIAPGETLAGLKTPGADPPVDPTLFDFFFDNPAGTFSWNAAGDTIRLGDQSNETVDELVVKGVHQGALEVDEHPSVLGLATELDAAALATATSQSDNDEPLQWCAWANDGTDPSGANPDCGRVRLHEIFVATQAEPRFVELHLPFGGSTGTLQLVVVDGDGVVVSTHVVEGDRMAVGEPLVYVDDLDTAIGLATDGAVMIVRDGALLDVYGFGTQTVAVSVDGHAMVEGTPGPAQTDSESAQRSSPGGDTGDNATDFVQATPTQGAL